MYHPPKLCICVLDWLAAVDVGPSQGCVNLPLGKFEVVLRICSKARNILRYCTTACLRMPLGGPFLLVQGFLCGSLWQPIIPSTLESAVHSQKLSYFQYKTEVDRSVLSTVLCVDSGSKPNYLDSLTLVYADLQMCLFPRSFGSYHLKEWRRHVLTQS